MKLAYESLGSKRGLFRERTVPPVAIVVHTTGRGIPKRWAREQRGNTPHDTALRVYSRIMKAGPHYVIGQAGECTQVTDESLSAWHVGGRRSHPYFRDQFRRPWSGHQPKYNWWYARWVGLKSPTDLASGKLWLGGSCNENTLGIEVVPPVDPHEPWSEPATRTLVGLLDRLTDNYNIPYDKYHIVTHSDAHPLSRTTGRGEPWDPSPLLWQPERLGIR